MVDEPEGPTPRLDRRRVLGGLGALGLGGLAGCSGGDSTAPTTGNTSSPSGTTAGAAPDTTTAMAPPTETTVAGPPIGEQAVVDLTGPEIIVAADGSGDVETIEAAVRAAPRYDEAGAVIRLRPGTYEEKVKIPEPYTNLTLVGEDVRETVVTYDDNNEDVGGTFDTASVTVMADDFTAHNVTFENSYGRDDQAVALYAGGDRATFGNCRFLGHMDTLLTEGGGNRQYFQDCEIAGTTDFIFGGATALFENCRIVSRETSDYVAAPATPPSVEFGYVFEDCVVVGPDAGNDSVVLGRPWKEGAKAVYLRSYVGDHIEPKGWDDWGGRADTAFFAEYDNEGPGFAPTERVDWSHQLTESEAAGYTRPNVLDGWNPQVTFAAIGQPVFDTGATAPLGAVVRNLSTATLEGVEFSLDPPDGDWAVAADTPVSFDELTPQSSHRVGWGVTVPASIRGQYDLTVSGGSDALTATEQVMVIDGSLDAAPMPYGINAGSDRGLVIDDLAYLPMTHPSERDYVFSDSSMETIAARLAQIADTGHDDLYRSAIAGEDLVLQVALAEGTYDLTFHLAELEHEQAGERVFDVSVGGETVIEGLDVVDRVGPRTALSTTIEGVDYGGGRMAIETTSRAGDSLISGLTVREA